MERTLDLGGAWDSTVQMFRNAKELLLVIGGVFLFLPNLLLGMVMPASAQATELPEGAGLEEAMEMLSAQIPAATGGTAIVTGIIQMIGTLAILYLVMDRNRPTAGAAISSGARGFLPYFLSQLVLGLGFVLIAVIPIGLLAAGIAGKSTGMIAGGTILLLLVALPLFVYVTIKTLLAAPVLVAEGVTGPVDMLKRSWALTKGNSLRIFALFLLVGIVMLVVYMIFGMLIGLLFGIAGESGAAFGQAFAASLFALVSGIVSTLLAAAVYNQLSDRVSPDITQTFA